MIMSSVNSFWIKSTHLSIILTVLVAASSSLIINDQCTSHSQCPKGAICRKNSCGVNVCLCDRGYVRSRDLRSCLVLRRAGESCNHTSKCIRFSKCYGGLCKCLFRSKSRRPDGRCNDYLGRLRFGDTGCTQTMCSFLSYLTCVRGTCECRRNYRTATSYELWINPEKNCYGTQQRIEDCRAYPTTTHFTTTTTSLTNTVVSTDVTPHTTSSTDSQWNKLDSFVQLLFFLKTRPPSTTDSTVRKIDPTGERSIATQSHSTFIQTTDPTTQIADFKRRTTTTTERRTTDPITQTAVVKGRTATTYEATDATTRTVGVTTHAKALFPIDSKAVALKAFLELIESFKQKTSFTSRPTEYPIRLPDFTKPNVQTIGIGQRTTPVTGTVYETTRIRSSTEQTSSAHAHPTTAVRSKDSILHPEATVSPNGLKKRMTNSSLQSMEMKSMSATTQRKNYTSGITDSSGLKTSIAIVFNTQTTDSEPTVSTEYVTSSTIITRAPVPKASTTETTASKTTVPTSKINSPTVTTSTPVPKVSTTETTAVETTVSTALVTDPTITTSTPSPKASTTETTHSKTTLSTAHVTTSTIPTSTLVPKASTMEKTVSKTTFFNTRITSPTITTSTHVPKASTIETIASRTTASTTKVTSPTITTRSPVPKASTTEKTAAKTTVPTSKVNSLTITTNTPVPKVSTTETTAAETTVSTTQVINPTITTSTPSPKASTTDTTASNTTVPTTHAASSIITTSTPVPEPLTTETTASKTTVHTSKVTSPTITTSTPVPKVSTTETTASKTTVSTTRTTRPTITTSTPVPKVSTIETTTSTTVSTTEVIGTIITTSTPVQKASTTDYQATISYTQMTSPTITTSAPVPKTSITKTTASKTTPSTAHVTTFTIPTSTLVPKVNTTETTASETTVPKTHVTSPIIPTSTLMPKASTTETTASKTTFFNTRITSPTITTSTHVSKASTTETLASKTTVSTTQVTNPTITTRTPVPKASTTKTTHSKTEVTTTPVTIPNITTSTPSTHSRTLKAIYSKTAASSIQVTNLTITTSTPEPRTSTMKTPQSKKTVFTTPTTANYTGRLKVSNTDIVSTLEPKSTSTQQTDTQQRIISTIRTRSHTQNDSTSQTNDPGNRVSHSSEQKVKWSSLNGSASESGSLIHERFFSTQPAQVIQKSDGPTDSASRTTMSSSLQPKRSSPENTDLTEEKKLNSSNRPTTQKLDFALTSLKPVSTKTDPLSGVTSTIETPESKLLVAGSTKRVADSSIKTSTPKNWNRTLISQQHDSESKMTNTTSYTVPITGHSSTPPGSTSRTFLTSPDAETSRPGVVRSARTFVSSTEIAIATGIGSIVFIITLIVLTCILFPKRRKRPEKQNRESKRIPQRPLSFQYESMSCPKKIPLSMDGLVVYIPNGSRSPRVQRLKDMPYSPEEYHYTTV